MLAFVIIVPLLDTALTEATRLASDERLWIYSVSNLDHQRAPNSWSPNFGNDVELVFREISLFRQSRNKLNSSVSFDFVERSVRLVAFDNVA